MDNNSTNGKDDKSKSEDQKKKDYLIKRKVWANPHAKDIAEHEEERFLALLLKHPESLEKAMNDQQLTYKCFLHIRNAAFFGAITKYYNKHQACVSRDAFRAATKQNIKDEKRAASQRALFDRLFSIVIMVDDYSALVSGIKDRYTTQVVYEYLDGGQRLVQLFSDYSDGGKERMMSLKDGLVNALTLVESDDEFMSSRNSGDALDGLMKTLEMRRVTDIKDRGIICGIKEIDDTFYGFRRGKYLLLLGLPNGGKTTTMINFAYNMSKAQYRVCYITIESTDEEIMERIISRASFVPGHFLRRGLNDDMGLNDARMNELYIAAEKFRNTAMEYLEFITIPQNTNVDVILSMVDKKRKVGGFDVVIVDYLDVIDSSRRYPNRPDLEIGNVSESLQAYGKKHDILMISAQSIKNSKIEQLRKKEYVEDPMNSTTVVGVEDVGGSQKLSRDADYVFSVVPFFTRDKLKVELTKARYDATAGISWSIPWDADICAIGNFSDEMLGCDNFENPGDIIDSARKYVNDSSPFGDIDPPGEEPEDESGSSYEIAQNTTEDEDAQAEINSSRLSMS